jgi:hypothetical protein
MPDTIDDAQEHPIIFNEWSIQRIFAGEKTQTRRIVKPQPPQNKVHGPELYTPAKVGPGGKIVPGGDQYGVYGPHGEWGVKCPYGQPGSRLWVREAFRLPHTYDEMSPSEYVDEGQPHIVRFEADEGDYNAVPKDGWGRKRPSIHMPKELCRLRLRVEDVRVERVKEISPSDAHAEGIPRKPRVNGGGEVVGELNPVGGFKKKWDQIHGDGAWERNDWVWVVEFARYDE